jgi:small subunit ribosomal protein S20
VANIKSAKKRNIQNEKRRLKNVPIKSAVRTAAKKIIIAINNKGENSDEVINNLQKNFIKTIDSAASKGVIHWKTTARKKSRIAKRINSLKQPQVG